jgi:hypothetical protein
MSSGRTAKWQDGRVIAWTHHNLGGMGESEPDDDYILPHGMTWGEFKELRASRCQGHGKNGQQHKGSKTQLRKG